jgi:homocysteine S-methyltransferase
MIVDGGLGLELERRGFTYTTTLWSGEALLARPDLIVDIHRAFLDAGARVIETASYQLSHRTLRAMGYDEAAIDELFARAVELARTAIASHTAVGAHAAIARHTTAAGGARAADALATDTLAHDEKYVVAASMGPYGATVGDGSEYSAVQHLDAAALYEFHAERMRTLAQALPDVFLFETIPTRIEALVVAEVACDLEFGPVWMSLACADGERTYGGDDAGALVAELEAFDGIDVVGVNCTPPAAIAPLARTIRAATAKPILVCPNLGQHWEPRQHGLVGGTPHDDLVRRVPEWLALGVTHIGGCCGVGPETIAAIAAQVAQYRAATPASTR